jgi:hypothetical protein
MYGHYRSKIMGVFSGPLNEASCLITNIFNGISLLFMEDYAPSTFLGSWALVAPYLCSRFHIFD